MAYFVAWNNEGNNLTCFHLCPNFYNVIFEILLILRLGLDVPWQIIRLVPFIHGEQEKTHKLHAHEIFPLNTFLRAALNLACVTDETKPRL